MKVLRVLGGVVLGYAVMVLLITLVQETWFGGVAWGKSPPAVLAVAGFLTAASAVIGSVAATVIARPSGRTAALIMCSVVVLETTVLLRTGRLAGPLWFDLAAAGSLLVAILLGAEACLRWMGRRASTIIPA